MIDRLKRSKLLRLCLVAFLIPLMVLGMGSNAQAVAPQNLNFSFSYLEGPKGTLVSDVSCNINLSYIAAHAVVSGTCKGGPDLMPFWTTPGEPGSEAVFYFGGEGDPTGNRSSVILQEHDDDGLASVAGTIPQTTIYLGADFVPSSLCMTLGDAGAKDGGYSATDCKPVVGSDPVAECDLGSAAVLSIEERYEVLGATPVNLTSYGARDITLDIDLQAAPPYGWRAYAILRHEDEQPYYDKWNSVWNRMVNPPTEALVLMGAEPVTTGGTTFTFKARTTNYYKYGDGAPQDETMEIIGIGLYQRTRATEGDHYGSPPYPTYPLGFERMGVNDSTLCSFYWGEQIWDDGNPDGGSDQPAGDFPPPVDGPPVDPPEPPTEETPTDMWGALWSILKAIANGIGRLISAVLSIPGKILAGLKTLFIPSDGFLDDDFDRLRQDADDSNMGDWNEAFSGIFGGSGARAAGAPAEGGESGTGSATFAARGGPGGLDFGGGGCQGPSIDIARIIPEGMGSQFDTIHPFAACEGLPAEMASWSRLLTGLFLALFGAFKIFGMVAQATIGMKTTEILRDFDWKSDRLDGRSL